MKRTIMATILATIIVTVALLETVGAASNRHTVRAELGDRVRIVLPHGTHEDICWHFRGRGNRRPVMVLFVGQHGTDCHRQTFTSAPEPRR